MKIHVLSTRSILTAAMWVVLLTNAAAADWSIDLEGGVAFNGYNDVRIPGDAGSDISLTSDLDADPAAYYRVRLSVDLGDRHRLAALVVPLRVNASGSIDRDIDFNGVTFSSGAPLQSRYRFDSYRLTYSYALRRSDRVRFDIGFTAKIRDAAIRLEGDGKSSEKTNTGFVPLIHFALDWSIADDIGLLVRGDALAAPQGRAEDVLAAAYVDVSRRLRLRLGYRILEGGADNDEVYSFALFHYLSAGMTIRL